MAVTKKNSKGATKHFIIFVHYDENDLHTIDCQYLLEETGYKSISKYIKAEGTDDLVYYFDDVERYLSVVNSVYVVECDYKPDYFRNLNDGDVYEGREVDFERKRMILPKKGLFATQYNSNLMYIFDVEVDANEEFDIKKLCVCAEGYKIIYDDKEYDSCGCDGDEDGDLVYYLDGKRIDG